MFKNLLSIVFGIVVIAGSLLIRGALLPVVHYGEAQAALSDTAALSSAGENTDRSWRQARAAVLQSIAYAPENLLKISSGDVLALLQEPELVRGESATQMWQYRTQACVLDLYLAENGAVVHYEMRARDRSISDAQIQSSCMPDLVAQGSGAQTYKTASN